MKVDNNTSVVQGKLEFVKKMSGAGFDAALAGAMDGGGVKPKTAADELEAYVKMSPAERMRDTLMKKLGVTEEELAAMPPEQRKAFEEKISELVKEEMAKTEQKKGTRVDTSA